MPATAGDSHTKTLQTESCLQQENIVKDILLNLLLEIIFHPRFFLFQIDSASLYFNLKHFDFSMAIGKSSCWLDRL